MNRIFAALALAASIAFLFSCNQDETSFGPQDVQGFEAVIKGRMTDRQDRALAGVLVTANPGGLTTVSGLDGSFMLSGLAAGSYRVTMAKDDYRDTSWTDPVRVGLSVVRDLGSLAMRYRFATIVGVVEDSIGTLQQMAGIAVEDQAPTALAVSGRFTLGKVEPGRVRLFTAIQGVGYGTLDLALTADDTVKNVRIRIVHRGGSVVGQVVGSDGKGVVDAQVQTVGGALKTSTDSVGRFRLTEVPGEGKVALEVVKGTLATTVTGVRVAEGSQTDVSTISIAPSPAIDTVRVRDGLAIGMTTDSVLTLVAETISSDTSFHVGRYLWSVDDGRTWDTTMLNVTVIRPKLLVWKDGDHLVRVKVVSTDGRASKAGAIKVRLIPPPDWTAPRVVRVKPGRDTTVKWVDSIASVAWIASDDRKMREVWIGGVHVAGKDSLYAIDVTLPEGSKTVRLVAKDSAGNTTTDSLILRRRAFDNTPPTVMSAYPKKDSTFVFKDSSITVSWNVSDAGGLEFVWIDTTIVKVEAGKVGKLVTLPVGLKVVRLLAKDSSGNLKRDSLSLRRLPLDTTRPTVWRVNPTRDTVRMFDDFTMRVAWRLTDASGMEWVTIDSQLVRPDKDLYALDLTLPVGTKIVKMQAKDSSGNFAYDTVKVTRNCDFPDSLAVVYGTMTDDRDNRKYPTVKMGHQTWMSQSLSFSGAGVCNGMNPDSCVAHGRMYTWIEAMAGTASASSAGAQGVCPKGWHVPNNAEWQVMEMAAKVNYMSLPPCATANYDESWFNSASGDTFWSASEADPSNAWFQVVDFKGSGLTSATGPKPSLHAVRCVADSP